MIAASGTAIGPAKIETIDGTNVSKFTAAGAGATPANRTNQIPLAKALSPVCPREPRADAIRRS